MGWRLTVPFPFPVPVPITFAPTSAMASAVTNFLKREFSLNSTCVLLVACGHITAVYLDHVRLQVERRVEDDKFLGEALCLRARVVGVCEMAFLYKVMG